MARLSYLFEYEKSVTTPPATTPTLQKFRSTFSCIPRVAKFLGIDALAYVATVADLVDHATYTREYTKANGTVGTLTIPAGKIVYTAYGKANAKTVVVKTGAKTTKGTPKVLHFTFPSFMNAAQIADNLGQLIPAASVAAVGVAPTATQIEPFFSFLGGKKYPLPTNTAATATPEPKVAITPTEAVAFLAESTSVKRKIVIVP